MRPRLRALRLRDQHRRRLQNDIEFAASRCERALTKLATPMQEDTRRSKKGAISFPQSTSQPALFRSQSAVITVPTLSASYAVPTPNCRCSRETRSDYAAVVSLHAHSHMLPTLIALHGYTMTGARLRSLGGALFDELEPHFNLLFPDAPHLCPPEAARDAFATWGMIPPDPPHFRWWRSIDDGQVYEGWETACAQIRALLPAQAPAIVLGFSQGAVLAATLAALSARGNFPKLEGVVLIAGGVPRAHDLSQLFKDPIAVPSLHVWGERDPLAHNSAPRLAECFHEAQRQTLTWPGSHAIPQRGPAANTITRFLHERLSSFDSASRETT